MKKKTKSKRGLLRAAEVEVLTPKQQRFIEEYLGACRFNGTQAALKAGYSPKTARQIATENLSKPVIKAAIERHRQALTAKSKLDAHEIHEQVRRIMHFDHRKIFNEDWEVCRPNDIPDECAIAINKIKVTETTIESNDGQSTVVKRTVEVGVPDKLKAAELAARLGGMLNQGSDDDSGDGFIKEFHALIRENRAARQKEAG